MTISRAEVITSVERRRRWSQDEKERLVAASLEPGANVSEVARVAGLHVSQLFRWRKELCRHGEASIAPFVPVEIGSSAPPREVAEAPLTTTTRRRKSHGIIEIDRLILVPGTASGSMATLMETRFLDDGRICLTNNCAERALRGIALGRRNWTFAGSQRGANRAAIMLTMITTCRLNDVDPKAWLADVLTRIADLPTSRLHELLPWEWKLLRQAAEPSDQRAA
ncbi:transposase-like protein [Bradyrhizobium sp. USDA 4508]